MVQVHEENKAKDLRLRKGFLETRYFGLLTPAIYGGAHDEEFPGAASQALEWGAADMAVPVV
jgi:hypothetical protein